MFPSIPQINRKLPQTQVIERTPRGEVPIDVYTRLMKDRIIWLGSEINAEVANTVMAQLLYLDHDDSEEDIYLYINSPGGSIEDGLGIYDTMQFIQPDVVTICAGNSYSVATLLLLAGTKGKRYALPNATIHQQPSRIEKLSATSADIESHTRHVLNMEDRVNRIIAHHTGQPLEKVKSDYQRDRYFTAEEAVEYGIIDRIISKSSSV